MNLLEKITARFSFNKASADPEYFFALTIGLSQLTASVWEMTGNKLDILSESSLPYHDHDDLIDKSSLVLDKAVGALDIEPRKILFGVPDEWSRDDDLKEPYLKLLRRILKECDLQPLAYVSISNALTFILQKQEGVPPTAIFLGVGEYIEVSLVRGGKVVENRSSEHSGSLFDGLEKVLSQITEAEVLPSKILLYSTKKGGDLVKLRNELMSFHWMQKLPFLHFPKIDILEEGIENQAVIIAGAAELNPDVTVKHNLLAQRNDHKSSVKEIKNIPPEDVIEETVEKGELDKSATEESGFVQGDIREQGVDNKIKETDTDSGAFNADDEGLLVRGMEDAVEDQNLTMTDLPENGVDKEGEFVRMPLSNAMTGEEKAKNHESLVPTSIMTAITAKINRLLPEPVKRAVSRIHLPSLPSVGKLALIPVLLAAAALSYIYFVKATVTIFVEPKVLERSAEIVADPTASVIDEEKRVIPGTPAEITVNGSEEGEATGKKQIGDPAKGKVIIYNRTNSEVSFSQGTILTANNLKFTLDMSTEKIASQSSSIGDGFTETIKPGGSDAVGITAADIGPEGNLPADTQLSIGNYSKSEVVAQVEEALSGGTSKDVMVVTADDQKKLKAKLLDTLRQQAEAELREKLSDEKKIIADALTIVDGKYTFSKQVNDQAKSFSLSANVRFKGTTYSDSDLRTMVAKLVETNVPEEFELSLQSTETQADVAKVEEDGRLVFKAKFRAKLLPKFDLEQLKKEVRGKGIGEVAERLRELDNVLSSEIKLSPSLPAQFARMPFLDKNISFIVTPK